MKRDQWKVLQNAFRYFILCSLLFFGGGVLIKHFIFHVEMTHEVITENLFVSLFTSVVFTFIFRSKWNRENNTFLFVSYDDKS